MRNAALINVGCEFPPLYKNVKMLNWTLEKGTET